MRQALVFAVEVFAGKQSRKVAYGVWMFIAANYFLESGKIVAQMWWWCALTCAFLIGFGTVADSVVEKLGDAIASVISQKAQTLINAKTLTNASGTTNVA